MSEFLVVSCVVLSLALFTSSCTPGKNPGLSIYTSLNEEVAQKLLAKYETETGTKVEFVRLSTGEAAARIEAEKNNPQASLWLGGVVFGHVQLKQKNLTEPYVPQNSNRIGKKHKDNLNYWTGLYLSYLAFAVNKGLLKKHKLQTPKTWKELTHSKWKGKVQVANPGTSGTSYNLLATFVSKFGEKGAFEYFKSLHQNITQYTRSGEAPLKNAALGETVVGIGFSHDILKLIYDSKANLEIVYPQDGTGYEIAAQSLIKGAKNPEAAKKLMDWVYSQTAAQVFADNLITPLVGDNLRLRENIQLPKDLILIDIDLDWAAKNKDRLVEAWNENINT